ncbi:MAG: hypothetical protein Q7J47_04775 [Azoarcus sp.]|nr:hypothetical protein [Azoarcus sp.]
MAKTAKPDEEIPSDTFAQKILGALAIVPGYGAFKEQSVGEDGAVVTHRFPWAIGMACSMRTGQYLNRFGDLHLPEWVGKLHPAQRSRLCQLAIDHGIRLPEQRPMNVPVAPSSEASLLIVTTSEKSIQQSRKKHETQMFQLIRDTLIASAGQEAQIQPFKLMGRGHEARVTLSRQLAQVLRSVDLPCSRLSGYGPSFCYPARVFEGAAARLKEITGLEILVSSIDRSQYSIQGDWKHGSRGP